MEQFIQIIQSVHIVSVLIILVIAVSAVQGMARGGAGSLRHLMLMVIGGALTIVSIYLSWKTADTLSPWLKKWLEDKPFTVPIRDPGVPAQVYYTVLTGLRDFPLFRFGVLFIISYALIKWGLQLLAFSLLGHARTNAGSSGSTHSFRLWISRAAGGLVGTLAGVGRALIVIAVLFIYTTLFPHSSFSAYIQDSELYRKGATEVIQPFAGDTFAEKAQVFTRAVEEELNQILRKKYEIIDANVPDEIAEAANHIVAGADTDEEKARRLYEWVGTRIQYDWEKVRLYEEERIWKEQSPQDTFATKRGVCIDYSRLYAVMAKAAGLQAQVETGLGFDGRGGYGPHAWNIVYLSEQDRWIPLDATWASSGGNWFNPPDFYETHIRDGV